MALSVSKTSLLVATLALLVPGGWYLIHSRRTDPKQGRIWNDVVAVQGLEGKLPHAARSKTTDGNRKQPFPKLVKEHSFNEDRPSSANASPEEQSHVAPAQHHDRLDGKMQKSNTSSSFTKYPTWEQDPPSPMHE